MANFPTKLGRGDVKIAPYLDQPDNQKFIDPDIILLFSSDRVNLLQPVGFQHTNSLFTVYSHGKSKLEGTDFKPLKSRGSKLKLERIWEFCIEMYVSLKGGEN